MINFKIFGKTEKKENPIGKALVPVGMPYVGGVKEGKELIKDGYHRNVIVYRAIREIATAASSISFDLHRGKEIIDKHPILDLLDRPNPLSGQASFLGELFTNLMISGEMWFAGAGPKNAPPLELWILQPMEMKVAPGTSGIPREYLHEKNGIKTVFPVDPITGKSEVFFLKLFNPLDPHRGMPPLRAAALAADAHNEGLNWNYNLMRKGARPSGWIKGTGGNPGAEIIARLKEWYRNHIQGSENAGEVGIMFGGAEFVPFEQNAKDMDFIQGMKEFAKYVSTAFGVPLPLIDNDAASMNNMEQSRERLWTDTVIPITNLFLDSLNVWLQNYFGPEYFLTIDEDGIQSLEGQRQKKFDRTIKAKDAGLITINEAREEIGFDKMNDPNADKLFINGGMVPLSTADIGYDPTEAEEIPDEDIRVQAQESNEENPKMIALTEEVKRLSQKSSEKEDRPIVINFSPEVKTPDTIVNIPQTVIHVDPPNVTVNSPDVTVHPPAITVNQPDITVNPPEVNIENHIKGIKVDLPARKKETRVQYDKDDNIVKTIQVETDL